jgi:predicted pyridoxine 5'-phosphate oxidase superfamily flavin-nucleotide-binding protein
MDKNFTTYAFTESVKAVQEQNGSRKSYTRMEKGDKFSLTDRETSFIESIDGFYMSTVGENGWPYVQYRGGERGFLKVLDKTTIGFADFRGNMQYISTGNILSTKKASLILMDYAKRQRLKIWAETKIVMASDEPDLLARLENPAYPAQIERLFVFNIVGFDWNCPQHITQRFTVDEFEMMMESEMVPGV